MWFVYSQTGSANVTVNIRLINDNEPVLSCPINVTFTEESDSIQIAPSLTVTDKDNRVCQETNITNATIELSPIPDGADEKLEIMIVRCQMSQAILNMSELCLDCIWIGDAGQWHYGVHLYSIGQIYIDSVW